MTKPWVGKTAQKREMFIINDYNHFFLLDILNVSDDIPSDTKFQSITKYKNKKKK